VAPAKTARFSKTQVALLAGTIGMFALAGVLAAVVVFSGGGSGTGPASTLAAPPPSTTTVTTTAPPTESSSSTTPTTTSTSAAVIAGLSDVDTQGFVGHAARCDAGSTLTAAIRTASSLAVVCETAPGSYYYHGERLRDGANVQLANAVPTDGGFDATNPADGAHYQVRPDELTILSNGHVDSSEPALEYGQD
jgi:serine/threonine-protein kinase